MEGADDENGLKRRRTRRLSHLVKFFLILLYFIDTNLCFIVYIACNIRKRAQTTRLASFGPLVSFFFLLCLIFFNNTILHRLRQRNDTQEHEKGPNGSVHCRSDAFGPLSKFFYFIFIFLYILMLFYRHKLPYRDVSDASRVYNLLLYIYLDKY